MERIIPLVHLHPWLDIFHNRSKKKCCFNKNTLAVFQQTLGCNDSSMHHMTGWSNLNIPCHQYCRFHNRNRHTAGTDPLYRIGTLEAKKPHKQVRWQTCVCIYVTILYYSDVIVSTMASQITSLTIVYSTVYSNEDQTKHQSSASQAFVRGNHRWPVNSPHKWPVTRKMFPFNDVITIWNR